jgi:hypothetical protein
LNIAINRVVCGTLSNAFITPIEGKTLPQLLVDNPDILTQKVLLLPKVIAGSTEVYCKNTTPFLNNENSLMWMLEAILRVAPGITIQGLGLALHLVRVTSLIVFVFFLLRVGLSPVVAIAVFTCGLLIINQVYPVFYYSIYPFLMPFTLLLIALLGLALSFKVHQRLAITGLVLVGIGIFSAFFSNLRTSYYPVILACLLIYVVLATIDLKRVRDIPRIHKILLPGLAVLSFFIGMAAFKTAFLIPLEKTVKTEYNASYHVIAHPLVLSLAIPPNNLAQREEIKWDDSQGLVLARRIDKSVDYLGPKYEQALFGYYKKLWSKYPDEMIGIYKNKLLMAGHDAQNYIEATFISKNLRDQFVRASFIPMSTLPNGGAYLALFFGIGIISLLGLRFINLDAIFALCALSSTGILLLIESAIIMPYFTISYHNYLLFWILGIGLLTYQVGFNLVLWLLRMAFRLVER